MDAELEILNHTPKGRRHGRAILFVHGAYTAAWCWEAFMRAAAERGYAAHAVSLSGHGKSTGHEHLHSLRIADYVIDLERAVAKLGPDTVLVGHSMGGFVVQKYLETRRAPAAVLLATVPPEGLSLSVMRLAFADPLLYQQFLTVQNFGTWSGRPETLRRALFSADATDAEIAPYFERFQQESHRAILDMTWLDLPLVNRVIGTPMLVLGARDDALFTPDAVERCARAYRARCAILPGLAHCMMLEPRWAQAATATLDWLDSTLPRA